MYGQPVKLAFLTVLALLLVDAPAQAGWKVDRATAIARIVWHDPCAGSVTLRWGDLTTRKDPGLAATWELADPTACTVTYEQTLSTTWERFCTLTLHAYGHLANYRDPLNPADPIHSHNPNSVMYAYIETHQAVITRNGHRVEVPSFDHRCKDRGRPYLAAHGDQGLGTTR